MNGYSEDLRRKIVSAVGRGMSKSQAARTFDVSLSSVKRYVNQGPAGRISSPEEEPRIYPEAGPESHEALGRGY